jgi:hypothetical protein
LLLLFDLTTVSFLRRIVVVFRFLSFRHRGVVSVVWWSYQAIPVPVYKNSEHNGTSGSIIHILS